jgi:hypothetical protein
MKRWMLAVVTVLAISLFSVTAADAAKEKKKAKEPGGKIEKIEGSASNLTLTVLAGKGKKAETITVTTDDKTSVMIDGQVGKLADLKQGEWVKLSDSTGKVTSIDASTKPPEKKAKKPKV